MQSCTVTPDWGTVVHSEDGESSENMTLFLFVLVQFYNMGGYVRACLLAVKRRKERTTEGEGGRRKLGWTVALLFWRAFLCFFYPFYFVVKQRRDDRSQVNKIPPISEHVSARAKNKAQNKSKIPTVTQRKHSGPYLSSSLLPTCSHRWGSGRSEQLRKLVPVVQRVSSEML